MPLIREAILTTVNALGEPHLAPLGLIAEGEGWILAPFHPSTTTSSRCDKVVASRGAATTVAEVSGQSRRPVRHPAKTRTSSVKFATANGAWRRLSSVVEG